MEKITNVISRLFGKFASCKFPKTIQNIINKSYVSFLGLDMSEFQSPDKYDSLNALFTRKLEKPRHLNGQENDFISPCDGLISEKGKIKEGLALQIKGFSYSVEKLLTKHVKGANFQNGSFINLYLSPKDYHRYHAPQDMRVLKSIQISGKLYPVNFKYLRKIPSLFCENERVILVCENYKNEKFYLIFVGALNVGKISFTFDEKIATNAKAGGEKFYDYENLYFKKGDELGRFEMGSTIVAIFESESIEFKKDNEKVKFGEIIATYGEKNE